MQSSFWRSQLDTLAAQAEEVRTLSTQVAADAAKPIKRVWRSRKRRAKAANPVRINAAHRAGSSARYLRHQAVLVTLASSHLRPVGCAPCKVKFSLTTIALRSVGTCQSTMPLASLW